MLTDANGNSNSDYGIDNELLTDENIYKFINYINSRSKHIKQMLTKGNKTNKNEEKNEEKFGSDKYVCKICNYSTNRKSNYTRHINSVKHKKTINEQNEQNEQEIHAKSKKKKKTKITETKITETKDDKLMNNDAEYTCDICSYSTIHYNNYNRHIETEKHKRLLKKELTSEDNYAIEEYVESPSKPARKNRKKKKYQCSCGKSYSHRPSLSRHMKTCKIYKKKSEDDELNTNISDRKFIKRLIKKYGTINQTIHNTQYNQFNLNIFLNETCKDAINLKDFVNNINYNKNTEDNLLTGNIYDSLANMVIDQLNDLDVTKRPIHCMDSKRQIVYVKDNNLWDKDNNCEKISQAINVMTVNQQKSDMVIMNNFSKENSTWTTNMNEQNKLFKASKNSQDCINKMKSDNLIQKIMDTTLLNKEEIVSDSIIEIKVIENNSDK